MASVTEQETFWRSEFGDEYTARNRGAHSIAANTALFSKVLDCSSGAHSVLELGANSGLNLLALRNLLPDAHFSAVEINERAAAELQQNVPDIDLHVTSILDFAPTRTWDFVFTKGVLIHMNPERLPEIYSLMHHCSSRYIFIAEYYNPQPTEVVYRGHTGKLFKRDFAGELLDKFPDTSLVNYGFVYHRDPNFPGDDITWFLVEKTRPSD